MPFCSFFKFSSFAPLQREKEKIKQNKTAKIRQTNKQTKPAATKTHKNVKDDTADQFLMKLLGFSDR